MRSVVEAASLEGNKGLTSNLRRGNVPKEDKNEGSHTDS